MIHPKAVQTFLAKPRDDFRWLKTATEAEVDAALCKVDPTPVITTPLMLHQKVCFLLGVSQKQFYFSLDIGTGKTLLALELLRYWLGRLNGYGLVITINRYVVNGWIKELAKWMPDLPYVALHEGSSTERWEQLTAFRKTHPFGLILAHYPAAYHLVTEHVIEKKGGRLKPKPTLIKKLSRDMRCLVLDESVELANQQSLSHRVVKALAKSIPVRYALVGRDFGRDPQQLWGQFYIIDGGASLGATLGLFREALFTKKKKFWGGPYSFDYKFDKSKEDDLTRLRNHRSIRYSWSECGSLPPLVQNTVVVDFPKDVMAYYAKHKAALLKAKGNFREIHNLFLRMRQLSSGFLGMIEDETGDRAAIEFPGAPKIEACMDIVNTVEPDRKIVIFYEFTVTGRRICSELAKAKIGYVWLHGGMKNAEAEQQKFDTSRKVKVMVAQHQCGGTGLNLQIANYVIFLESPVGCVDRDQAEGRCRRKGQERTVFQYDLVTRGSADERILAFHKEGADLFEALVKNPALIGETG